MCHSHDIVHVYIRVYSLVYLRFNVVENIAVGPCMGCHVGLLITDVMLDL